MFTDRERETRKACQDPPMDDGSSSSSSSSPHRLIELWSGGRERERGGRGLLLGVRGGGG